MAADASVHGRDVGGAPETGRRDEDVLEARAHDRGLSCDLCVAQLGTRLHVLLRPDTPDPAGRCSARLRDAGVEAQTTAVGASLEDVFVAATGFKRTSHVAVAG